MSKDLIEATGMIVQALPNAMFKVQLETDEGEATGHVVLCTISGKIRMHYIKLVPGDKVKLELTPYDLSRGRIVYRLKDQKRRPGSEQDSSDATDSSDSESDTTNDTDNE